jgi:Na+-driven multidrug efflux pump
MGRLDVSTDDVTGGPIAPTLVVLALPLVVQNLVQVLNQLVDTFWLGRLGEEEVAAVGVGGFYLLRYERMFSNAAEEAARSTAD